MIRSLWLISLSLILLLILPLSADDSAPATVTITQRAPISALAPDGSVSGMSESVVGTHYTFVSSDGQRLVIQDSQGTKYRIGQTATDYAVATPAPTADTTKVAAPSTSPAPVTNPAPPPPPASPAPVTNTPAFTDDAVAKINTGIGKPLFTAQNFWKESALLIANRVGLKQEDKTKWETSYRRYYYKGDGTPTYAPAAILGGNAYCVALYADASDAPTSALIAFTNDGDYQGIDVLMSKIVELKQAGDKAPNDADKQISDLQSKVDTMEAAFEKDRRNEADAITKNLTSLFGDPKRTTFGSNAVSRENVLRWDWNGASLLFTAQENKYNLLRIIPTELADNQGRTERIARDEMAKKLTDGVEHRPNGDVVITQLPMADQGLKGYCVPATWERVLRYTAVPGDMYSLSRIGGAKFGGGEAGANVATQLDDVLHDYGRKAEFVNIDTIDAHSLKRYIDQGIPVFWSVNPQGYAPSEQRASVCDRTQDWDQWKKLLEQSRTPSNKTPPELPFLGGHQVLITGYNPDSKEIAWSDPWGRDTKERWMTQEEAERCTLRQYYIITW